MVLRCKQNRVDHNIYADRYKTSSLLLPNIQHQTLQIRLILLRPESTRTMQFFYALLPLIPVAAVNTCSKIFQGPRVSISMIVTSAGCHLTLYTGPNQSSPNGSPIRFDTGAAVCWSIEWGWV